MEAKNTTIVGIIGPQLAGKATAAQYISECLLVPPFGIQLPLYETARARKVIPTPNCLAELEAELTKEHGENFLPEQLLRRMGRLGIIEGMNKICHIDYLRERARLVLIGVNAYDSVRLERARKRGSVITREDEAKTSMPGGLNDCLANADYRVTNNTSCRFDLQDQINKILQKEELL